MFHGDDTERVINAVLEREQQTRARELAARLLADPVLAAEILRGRGAPTVPLTPEAAYEVAWSVVARGLDRPRDLRRELVDEVFRELSDDELLESAEPDPEVAPLEHVAFHLRVAMTTTRYLLGSKAFDRDVEPGFRKAVEALARTLVPDPDELPKRERVGVTEVFAKGIGSILRGISSGEVGRLATRIGELVGVEAPPRDAQGRELTDPAEADEVRRERARQRVKRERRAAKAQSESAKGPAKKPAKKPAKGRTKGPAKGRSRAR